jgi:hypothetical protein
MARAAALANVMERGGKKPPPRFASEGEPEEDMERGGAPGEEPDDAEAEMDEEQGGEPESHEPASYQEHFELAVDDMADIMGVSPEDRADFGSALKAAIHSVFADAMGDEAGPPEEPGEGDEEPE